MSKSLLASLGLALLFWAHDARTESPALSPVEVVNLRMKHYNDHRIDAILALYSDDIEVYTYPNRLLGKGKSHLRRVLDDIFADTTVRVTISHQIAKDGYVVNEELVSYAGNPTQYVSIYEVRDGLIRSVRFIRD